MASRAARTALALVASATMTGCAGGDAAPDSCRTTAPAGATSGTTPTPGSTPPPAGSTQDTTRSPMPGVARNRAQEVMRARYQELRRRYPQIVGAGVVLVGDEREQETAYGIRLSLTGPDGLTGLPGEIDGVPLRYEVTGPYHAQGDPKC
ncbi:hypothetical protein [Nonomuraea zeae]|uniref:hypothetical protein n=1 Tax=Nonomuraea zeae TaxID=1642303 RepID=UPI0014789AF4|nr:hypothetical protein [Nonomuraea zeae]